MNKAVTVGGIDWWSAGDILTIGRIWPSLTYAPLIWTHTETMQQMVARFGWVDGKTYRRSEEPGHRWSMYSATAALVLAKELGATSVECFGVDLMGQQNWDGTDEPTADRSTERWARERVIWEKTRNQLEEAGVEVIRHGHH